MSSPPDGLAGRLSEFKQPPARSPERVCVACRFKGSLRRAAPALDPSRGAGKIQWCVLIRDRVQCSRSDQRQATARGPSRTGAGKEPSATQR